MEVGAFETYLAAVAQRLSPDNLEHCYAVSEAAAALAVLYGVDVDEARLAGLLHDWDREVGEDDLLAIAEHHELSIDPVEAGSPRLLHARTAALRLAEEFPELPADVLAAVREHTVGGPDMSDLSMVVYVADMIADGRAWAGVEDLRAAAGDMGLNELFGLAYEQTLAHLVQSRRAIHPTTVAVWNALVARGR